MSGTTITIIQLAVAIAVFLAGVGVGGLLHKVEAGTVDTRWRWLSRDRVIAVGMVALAITGLLSGVSAWRDAEEAANAAHARELCQSAYNQQIVDALTARGAAQTRSNESLIAALRGTVETLDVLLNTPPGGAREQLQRYREQEQQALDALIQLEETRKSEPIPQAPAC